MTFFGPNFAKNKIMLTLKAQNVQLEWKVLNHWYQNIGFCCLESKQPPKLGIFCSSSYANSKIPYHIGATPPGGGAIRR